jgi:WXG100 family type VII secretion target
MTAPKIRADYEGLKKISQSFSTESDQIGAMTKNVQSSVDTLRGGDWVGPGATAFYQEMDSAVFPSLKRLGAALGEAARVTNQINQLMNGAERDAAAVLRATGGDEGRHKDGGSSGASTGSIVGGIVGGVLGFAVGGVLGAAAGAAIGSSIGDSPAPPRDAPTVTSEQDKARQAAVQKFMDAGDRQGAVDEAVKQYDIDVSAVKGKVTYDAKTDGEGKTGKDGTVTIGDDAFTSPQWLASSIGHEGVHAQQARDGRWDNSKQGVALNETEAYDWEIKNADRNGLSAKDKATLADRRATKYDHLTRANKARADAGDYTLPW